jgi:hypothetical protein
MNKIFLVFSLVAITFKSHSNTVFDLLKDYKKELPATGTTSGSQKILPATSTTTTDYSICEKDQTSLPLSFLTSLILDQNDDFKFSHDSKNKTLTISSPSNMISNCSNMLQFNLKTKEIKGKIIHAVEAELKKTSDCTESGCKYKVAVKKDGKLEFQDEYFEPTLKGFEDCLNKTGVISEGTINPLAIHPAPMNVGLEIPNQSGPLYFLSSGNMTSSYPAKYSKNYDQFDGPCEFYELAHPQVSAILTEEDEIKKKLDKEAEDLKKCTNYNEVSDFIEKYTEYAKDLGEIANKLLLEAAQKSATAIKAGKYSDDDLKVIEDFHELVVKPKIDLGVKLHEEWIKSQGEEKKAKKVEFDKVLNEISSYGKAPYFLSVHTNKLISDGKFEEAEKLNSMKLMIQHHQRLGAKENNVVITPEVASQRVKNDQVLFSKHIENERERYDYRTGQSTGKAEYYANLRNKMNENIKIRTENYRDEIQAEYERIQPPNGYCYRPFRNTQTCIQESQERIKELVSLLQHYNNVDKERFEEYDAQAKEWGGLEQEGRRYIATQNGEEPPLETKTYILTGDDETVDAPVRSETERSDVYNFEYNNSNNNRALPQNPQYYNNYSQMTPQQYTNPVSPYQYNNMFTQQNPYTYYNQPYLGQQSYHSFNQNTFQQPGVYNFNWNNPGNMMQQPYGQNYRQPSGQFPYWNQPYQAYGNFQMYR